MISFRYHIVSLAAVFLALALGVTLGSTSVTDRLLAGVRGDKEALQQQNSTLRVQRDAQRAQLSGAERFSESVAPVAVRDALRGRSVAVVSTAGAEPADGAALKRLLRDSGAEVTGQLQLTEGFMDPARADQLRELVTRLLPSGGQLPTAADPGTLAGGLIGPLASLDPSAHQPQASPAESAAALGGLAEAGFVRGGEDMRPADLVVVLTGGQRSGEAAADRASTVARFAGQVDHAGSGAVLAGRRGSAAGTGAVGSLRADTSASASLSSVDNVDSPAGRVATVLALREQLEHRAGRYGIAGSAQGPVPATVS